MMETLYEIQDGGEGIYRKEKQPVAVIEGNLNGHSRIIIDSGVTSHRALNSSIHFCAYGTADVI